MEQSLKQKKSNLLKTGFKHKKTLVVYPKNQLVFNQNNSYLFTIISYLFKIEFKTINEKKKSKKTCLTIQNQTFVRMIKLEIFSTSHRRYLQAKNRD